MLVYKSQEFFYLSFEFFIRVKSFQNARIQITGVLLSLF